MGWFEIVDLQIMNTIIFDGITEEGSCEEISYVANEKQGCFLGYAHSGSLLLRSFPLR